MKLHSVLLYPFSKAYKLVTDVRNLLYDRNFYRSASFEVPLISVGNLTVGGTGKTPMVEYLIRMLRQDYQLATLSRGYGRKTKGFRLAEEKDNALTIGDEPYQYFLKFQPQVQVTVGEERIMAIPEIMSRFPNTQAVILDDAFQHRKVRPQLNILLNDYNRPFYTDHVLPAGRLRESRHGARRADVVVVTKCPDDLSAEEKSRIEQQIKKYCRADTPVFFAGIRYEAPLPVKGTAAEGRTEKMPDDVLLVSGIANPKPLENYVNSKFQTGQHIIFPDHHVYRQAELRQIQTAFGQMNAQQKAVLVTEKDMARLLNPEVLPLLAEMPVYYLPISFYFQEKEDEFEVIVKKVLP